MIFSPMLFFCVDGYCTSVYEGQKFCVIGASFYVRATVRSESMHLYICTCISVMIHIIIIMFVMCDALGRVELFRGSPYEGSHDR